MEEIINAISMVGFPITACIGLAWFINRIYIKLFEIIDKLLDKK